MPWLRKASLFLLPVALLIVLGFRVYRYPQEVRPDLHKPFAHKLLERTSQLPVPFAVLFAPMPLCLAATFRFRNREKPADPVRVIMAQLSVLVAVQVSIFFLLIALGIAVRIPFLTSQGVLAMVGIAALGRVVLMRKVAARAVCGASGVYLIIALVLAGFGLASVHLGQDCNFDFVSYHYYIGHAFLHNRRAFDLAVGDFMTDVNPLLQAAQYLVIQSVPPVWIGFIVGAIHGISALLLFGLAFEILSKTERLGETRLPLALACAVAGVCEPIFLVQLGTSFHDNLLAGFVLCSLLLIVRLVGRQSELQFRSAGAISVFAGALTGMAAGFKLTIASYAVAIVLALLGTPVGWKRRLALAGTFSAGVVAGFLISNGYWMAGNYAHYSNPVFPFYNTLFKSPYWPDMNMTYLHNSINFRWFDHLLVPFYFARKSNICSEAASTDTRLAVAYVLLILVVGSRLVALLRSDCRSAERLREALKGRFTPEAVLVLSFVLISYIIWYLQFRILRYLVAPKILAPLVCVILSVDLVRSRKRLWVVSSLLLVLVALWIDLPWYGRGEWQRSFFDVRFQARVLKEHEKGIVLMSVTGDQGGLAAPIGAVVAEMPQSMRYVRIDSSEILGDREGKPLRMAEEAQRLVGAHDGPMYLLTINEPPNLRFASALLEKYDLVVAEGTPPELITSAVTPVLGLWTLTRRSREHSGPTPVANASSGPLIR